MDQSLQFFFTSLCFQGREHATMHLCVFVLGGVRNQHPLRVRAESQQQKSVGPEPQRGLVSALSCSTADQQHWWKRDRSHSQSTGLTARLKRCFDTLKATRVKPVFTHGSNFPAAPVVSTALAGTLCVWHFTWDFEIRQVNKVMCWLGVWGFGFPTV